MRFITEFELAEGNINNTYLSIEAKKDSEMKIGFAMGNAFGWESSENNLRHKIEIEAFPMDKWIEFKNRLLNELDKVSPSEIKILRMIKELEFYGAEKSPQKGGS